MAVKVEAASARQRLLEIEIQGMGFHRLEGIAKDALERTGIASQELGCRLGDLVLARPSAALRASQ